MNFCVTISNVDWTLTKDVISIVGTLGALIIGGLGLSTWRRQLKGSSEYELAKKAIFITYEVQQAIQSVRNPLIHLSREEVEAGRQLQEEIRIYDERMNYLLNKWTELQTIRLETKVIWSDKAHDAFNELQSIIGNLKGAVWLHFWMKGAYAGPGATIDKTSDRIMENDKIVYFTADDDEFSQRISASVRKVEFFFSPKIGKNK